MGGQRAVVHTRVTFSLTQEGLSDTCCDADEPEDTREVKRAHHERTTTAGAHSLGAPPGVTATETEGGRWGARSRHSESVLHADQESVWGGGGMHGCTAT